MMSIVGLAYLWNCWRWAMHVRGNGGRVLVAVRCRDLPSALTHATESPTAFA